MTTDLTLFRKGRLDSYIEQDSYHIFAKYYDYIMKNIYYDSWCNYLRDLLYYFNSNPKLVLDLACGTGNMTLLMKEAGYEVHGLDLSEDMLKIARQKLLDYQYEVPLFQDSMTSFKISFTYDLVFSFHNSINYLCTEKDFCDTAKCVADAMDEGGLFIFDLSSELNVLKNYDNQQTFENLEEFAYVWFTQYHPDSGAILSTVDVLLHETEKVYRERHFQKVHFLDATIPLLEKYFSEVYAFNSFSFDPPNEDSLAYHIVCVK